MMGGRRLNGGGRRRGWVLGKGWIRFEVQTMCKIDACAAICAARGGAAWPNKNVFEHIYCGVKSSVNPYSFQTIGMASTCKVGLLRHHAHVVPNLPQLPRHLPSLRARHVVRNAQQPDDSPDYSTEAFLKSFRDSNLISSEVYINELEGCAQSARLNIHSKVHTGCRRSRISLQACWYA